MLCTKLAHFKWCACYRSQNSWGGASLPLFSISSSFKKLFKDVWASRLWVMQYEYMEFGGLWSSLTYFLFNDAPNFLYRWKIWTADSQLSTRALLLQSHAVVIAAVCGVALSCWNTRNLEGSIHCSKTFIHLSAFIVLSKTFKLPIPYELMHPHTSEMLAFELNADEMLEGLPLL